MPEPEIEFDSPNLAYVESLYADFLRDPESVPEHWRRHFRNVTDRDGGNGNGTAGFITGPSRRPPSIFAGGGNGHAAPADAPSLDLQHRVDQLIRNYRVRGHRIAQLDPLGLPRQAPPELDPVFYGFTEADMDRAFTFSSVRGDRRQWPLRRILESLRETYCRHIGVQFMHIDDLHVREWLQERMEATHNRINLDRSRQLRILTRLTDAVIFERFLQKKYIGAKTFSLEGAESLIPLLEMAIEKAGGQGVREIVMAMAHRGRLNVLANILGKSALEIFREFEDTDPHAHIGRGDVKYHLGHSSDWFTADGQKVHLSLCFNPSHLEFINPVACGRMRAKMDRGGPGWRAKGLCLQIHGDAAFAGEGVVQETLNLSELEGYTTGGTLHVVLNNQLGFTTGPSQARSAMYATSVAKMLASPIFHVNGEHPEAVAQVVNLALDFRAQFQRDVFIDMYCYRRRGHNEGDEPAFTQPILYEAINKRKNVRDGYLEHLLELGEVTEAEAEAIAEQRLDHLERELTAARDRDEMPRRPAIRSVWNAYAGGRDDSVPEVDTGITPDAAASLLERLTVVPEDFEPHPKVRRLLEQRREMAAGERPLDWAAAEALALASITGEGWRIRMSGQDSERGTFSHRHSVLHDVRDGRRWMPLKHVAEEQGPVEIFNSPLSEAGVLGFEYGYSLDRPDGLVVWEAQFGDFINAAQVIVDQFITSSEDKWNRLTGLVLLLPHGFEGQGPEHSSARLERLLVLAAEHNIQVAYPTVPAQFFHLLRRQVLRPWRKPLFVLTPKSLLRSSSATSPLEACQGRFRRVLEDAHGADPSKVRCVQLCTGKVYFELEQYRREHGRDDVAIIRLEQLYPLAWSQLKQAIEPYTEGGVTIRWVQEEPANMGAWRYVRSRFDLRLRQFGPFEPITRPESASPATGSPGAHKLEQQQVIEKAFGPLE